MSAYPADTARFGHNGAGGFSGLARLDDWGVIRAQGADAHSFLQGQLTQDLLGISATSARLAGYCNARGRLLASFVVWSDASDEVWLACSADVLPAALKRLSMFVLRAKCRLSDASAEVVLWGASGLPPTLQPWQRTERSGQPWIGLPPAFVGGSLVPRALLAARAGGPIPEGPALPSTAWALLEVASAVPRIVAATAEHFVPQMVNLDLTGGVSFQKGCYPGQEVVARSQYRGTLKRRGYLLSGLAAARPGQEIVHSGDPGQPAGEVVNAASHQGRHWLFAELKIAATAGGSLHLGAADGPPLELLPMPYTLASEAP